MIKKYMVDIIMETIFNYLCVGTIISLIVLMIVSFVIIKNDKESK
jgi:uncharacterized membrane protein